MEPNHFNNSCRAVTEGFADEGLVLLQTGSSQQLLQLRSFFQQSRQKRRRRLFSVPASRQAGVFLTTPPDDPSHIFRPSLCSTTPPPEAMGPGRKRWLHLPGKPPSAQQRALSTGWFRRVVLIRTRPSARPPQTGQNFRTLLLHLELHHQWDVVAVCEVELCMCSEEKLLKAMESPVSGPLKVDEAKKRNLV